MIYKKKSDQGLNRKVVSLIDDKLKTCSDIFCLMSNLTKNSWWVPYEVGIAKAHKKNITSILTKLKTGETYDMPEYLNIEGQVSSCLELKKLLKIILLEDPEYSKMKKNMIDEIMSKNENLLKEFLI